MTHTYAERRALREASSAKSSQTHKGLTRRGERPHAVREGEELRAMKPGDLLSWRSCAQFTR
ncbi:hypothetical protein ABZ454_24140 [Streptomyces sp. NPDC005803]|uniref:hypothetical protein n=1 Tax=Streptomyces sp. NPDC005803 TaxID=3154297 RepID=UPI0033E4FCC8